jgi:hypothetical protein
MAMSKPVVTLILSLQHELTSKGIRVQGVLPGRTATDGWDVAGYSSRCADVFTLYFPNKTRRICSGASSYNIDQVLGPEGVAQNIPSGRDDCSILLWGMPIAILKTSICCGSCWNPPCSELITRALLLSASE